MPPSWLPNKTTLSIINNATTWALNVKAYGDALFDNLGSSSDKDTGTAPGQVPLNSDLGSSSTRDTGTADDQVPLNSDLGDAAHLGTTGSGSVVRQSIIDNLDLTGGTPKRLYYNQGGLSIPFSGTRFIDIQQDITEFDIISITYSTSLTNFFGLVTAHIPRLMIPISANPSATLLDPALANRTMSFANPRFYFRSVSTSIGFMIHLITGSNWRT